MSAWLGEGACADPMLLQEGELASAPSCHIGLNGSRTLLRHLRSYSHSCSHLHSLLT